ncbi:MAG: response regulator [Elusimicrobia bacterium]|nr:response regulator [Elusimicrobiota bacterium]
MKMKILIADDEPSVQRVLARIAQALGCETVLASDGDEAVALIEKERPDIVIMDLHMPNLDGLEALRMIHDTRPAMRVIVMTGDGADVRARAAFESGAAGFVTKPFNFAALRQTVSDNLALAETRA